MCLYRKRTVYQMNEDRLLSILLRQGDIRVTAISGRDYGGGSAGIHSLSRVCTAALGRQLMATAMMASQLKHESESLTTIFRGDGPAATLYAWALWRAGEGLHRDPSVELPLKAEGKLDVAGAVEERHPDGSTGSFPARAVCGGCDIVSGEIAEDLRAVFPL